jgi:hypothetical protein
LVSHLRQRPRPHLRQRPAVRSAHHRPHRPADSADSHPRKVDSVGNHPRKVDSVDNHPRKVDSVDSRPRKAVSVGNHPRKAVDSVGLRQPVDSVDNHPRKAVDSVSPPTLPAVDSAPRPQPAALVSRPIREPPSGQHRRRGLAIRRRSRARADSAVPRSPAGSRNRPVIREGSAAAVDSVTAPRPPPADSARRPERPVAPGSHPMRVPLPPELPQSRAGA